MEYTLAMFKARFPEFSDQGDALVQAMIDESVSIVNENAWLDLWATGVGYLTAHGVAISKKQASGDDLSVMPVRSMRAGSTMIGYDAIKEGTFSQNYLQSTSYGQQYLRLIHTIGTGVAIA